MESNTSSLLELQIDHQSSAHLVSSAKWGKFLAIVGFVICGLIVIGGLFAGTMMTSASVTGGTNVFGGLTGPFVIAIYVLAAALYFFPCLFLFNYSTSMLGALEGNDQEKLIRAFSQLKACFRFVGILTVIVLSIYALALIFSIIAFALR